MKDRKEFLRQTALFNAIGAAFQRALIYIDGIDNDAKERLKRDLEERLRRIETQYQESVSSEKHLQTIADVVKGMSRKHMHILKNRRFRVGIAQKAVNIYLKLLWCYGWIPEPPHCPIDSIVLAEVGDRQTKWTKMDDIEGYRAAIERIQVYIRQTGSMMSLSKWELYVWNNRRKTRRPTKVIQPIATLRLIYSSEDISMKRAKVKFPCIVGLVFFLISLPFILGLKSPSIHEGDLYSFLYVILNLPVNYVFGSSCDSIVNQMRSTPDLYRSNTVFIGFAHLFWILVAFVPGLVLDIVKKNSHNKSAHRIADKSGSR